MSDKSKPKPSFIGTNPLTIANAQQWKVRVDISVTTFPVDDNSWERIHANAAWTTELPLSAIGAVDYSAIAKSLTSQSMEDLRKQQAEALHPTPDEFGS
jgi:hypothetical protein